MAIRNLVCEGGGVKGVAYIGAMEVLEEKGILENIERVGGTSAGAINAVLLACGLSVAEQKKIILEELDFNKFLDDNIGVFRDIHRLLNNYGWHKGDFFHSWISDVIERKLGTRHATFCDFKKQGKIDLYVYGTNLSTGFGKVFSAEHTPTVGVADAVRISMSIPLLFKAVVRGRGDIYVDGGVLNNYPIRLFDRMKYLNNADDKKSFCIPKNYKDKNKDLASDKKHSLISRYISNKETLGLRLDSKREIAAFRYGDVSVKNDIRSFPDYAKALISTILNNQDAAHLETDDWKRTVYIDTCGVKTTDFGLSDEKKKALIDSGRRMTEDYFTWRNGKGSKYFQ